MDVHLLIVGDEILSGKRQDQHFSKIIQLLQARGLRLAGAQIVGDHLAETSAAIRHVMDAGGILLSCGGIGATPDDLTRQAAADAFGVPIARHPQGLQIIEEKYGDLAYPHRVLMVDFPQGATLIPNPVNRVPGFSMANAHFVPGFPEMAWPMLEWVLDHYYLAMHHSQVDFEYILRATGNAAEGDLLTLMEATLATYAGLKLSSLPFRGNAQAEPFIEFGFKGSNAIAAQAYDFFAKGLTERAQPWIAVRPPNRE